MAAIKSSVISIIGRNSWVFPIARRFYYAILYLLGRFLVLFQPIQLAKYLRQVPVGARGLHVGCGSNLLPGWLNADAYPRRMDMTYLDATKRFPIAENTFDVVYSEQMVEHISLQQAEVLLLESFRILRNGGTIRVATPDLRKLFTLLESPKTSEKNDCIQDLVEQAYPGFANPTACMAINYAVRAWGHLFIFDEETLALFMRRVGFVDIARKEIGVSDLSLLRGLEMLGDLSESHGVGDFVTMVFEGRKPD